MTAPSREEREEWRQLLADGLCLCSKSTTDWDAVAALLDALDAAEEGLRETAEWLAAAGYPVEFLMPDAPPPTALWAALVDVIHEDRDGKWHGNELTRAGVDDWLRSEALWDGDS